MSNVKRSKCEATFRSLTVSVFRLLNCDYFYLIYPLNRRRRDSNPVPLCPQSSVLTTIRHKANIIAVLFLFKFWIAIYYRGPGFTESHRGLAYCLIFVSCHISGFFQFSMNKVTFPVYYLRLIPLELVGFLPAVRSYVRFS